jgi:hypothetical protein
MQAFSRGWSFLKQAWGMAFKDKDLLKPSIYSLIVGSIVSFIGAIPIIIAAIFIGDSGTVGQIVIGVMGVILVFVQFVITYVFSAMTVYLIYGYLAEGDGRMDKAWAVVRRDFLDILTLAAASALVATLRNLANRNRGRGGVGASIARGATNLLSALWTEASYLVLPAMVIDDLNLKDGMARILKITKENLLLIGISTVGVRWVTGLIGFVLGVIGLAFGGVLFYGITAVLGFEMLGLVVGIGSAVVVASLFFMVASVIGSYTSTAYHTCLYIWAREVEKAHVQGSAAPVTAPAPLAAVLG